MEESAGVGDFVSNPFILSSCSNSSSASPSSLDTNQPALTSAWPAAPRWPFQHNHGYSAKSALHHFSRLISYLSLIRCGL